VYTQSPEASQYQNIDSYNVTTDLFNRCWAELYAGALNDYKFIIEQSLEEEEYHFYLIANLLQVYTFQVLADLHNQIPLAQSLDPTNIQPGYDDGPEVYSALLQQVGDALNIYESNVSGSDANPGTADLFFGVDMDQWLRFAHSLKLKLLMRISFTEMADTDLTLELIDQGQFITQDVAMTQFSDVQGNRNFFYEIEKQRLGGVYEYPTSGEPETDLKQIMLQKWVAMANVHNIEAFFELNRTGYPEYTMLEPTGPKFEPGTLRYSISSVLPDGQAPRRLFFPDISVCVNQNVPPQPNSIAEAVWWDQR